eukprot:g49212.t1
MAAISESDKEVADDDEGTGASTTTRKLHLFPPAAPWLRQSVEGRSPGLAKRWLEGAIDSPVEIKGDSAADFESSALNRRRFSADFGKSPRTRRLWLGTGDADTQRPDSPSLGRSPMGRKRWLARDSGSSDADTQRPDSPSLDKGASSRGWRPQAGWMSKMVDASKEIQDDAEELELLEVREDEDEDKWTARSVRWQCFCGTTALFWTRTRQGHIKLLSVWFHLTAWLFLLLLWLAWLLVEKYGSSVRLSGQELGYWCRAALLVTVIMYLGFLLQGALVSCTKLASWRVKEKELYFVRALSYTCMVVTLLCIQALDLTSSSYRLTYWLETLLVYALLSCMALIATAYAVQAVFDSNQKTMREENRKRRTILHFLLKDYEPITPHEERAYTSSFGKLRRNVLEGKPLSQEQLLLLRSVLFAPSSVNDRSENNSFVEEEKASSTTGATTPLENECAPASAPATPKVHDTSPVPTGLAVEEARATRKRSPVPIFFHKSIPSRGSSVESIRAREPSLDEECAVGAGGGEVMSPQPPQHLQQTADATGPAAGSAADKAPVLMRRISKCSPTAPGRHTHQPSHGLGSYFLNKLHRKHSSKALQQQNHTSNHKRYYILLHRDARYILRTLSRPRKNQQARCSQSQVQSQQTEQATLTFPRPDAKERDSEVQKKDEELFIVFSDLEARFKPATARRFWGMLTTESYMDVKLGEEEVVQGLQRFYFSVLSASSQPQLLANMGFIAHLGLKMMVLGLTLIYALWVFGYDIQASLLSILTAFATLSFAFSGIIREIVSALVMVLLAQPFQVGERVRLPGLAPVWQKFWVDRIFLMNTMMRDFYGEIHIFPNSVLASQEIINLTRTPQCNVEILIEIGFDTPETKLKQLFERITAFLEHKRLRWKPKFGMYVYGVSKATTLTLGLWLAHRLNSSSDWVFDDKSEVTDFIRKSMIELGIDWKPKRADLDVRMQNPRPIKPDDRFPLPDLDAESTGEIGAAGLSKRVTKADH